MKRRGIVIPQLPYADDCDTMGGDTWGERSMLDFARKCVLLDRKLANAAVCGSDAEAIKIRVTPESR